MSSSPKQRAEWKTRSKEIMGFEIGDRVNFIDGPNVDFAWKWGEGNNPAGVLKEHEVYVIEDIEIRSSYSMVQINGVFYNSAMFESVKEAQVANEPGISYEEILQKNIAALDAEIKQLQKQKDELIEKHNEHTRKKFLEKFKPCKKCKTTEYLYVGTKQRDYCFSDARFVLCKKCMTYGTSFVEGWGGIDAVDAAIEAWNKENS